MKKFFRVALVCALAGATLLYTGCTKDYSEDINSLQAKVDSNTGAINTLKDQVAALEAAKTEHAQAIQAAQQAIKDLQAADVALDQRIKTLESQVATNTGDIATIKQQIKDLQAEDTAMKQRISDLETTVQAHQTWLQNLEANKADKSWVEETLKNYATVKALDDSVAALNAKLKVMNQAISDIKETLGDLSDALKVVQDSSAAHTTAIAEMRQDIAALQADMTKAKQDIITAQEAANKAQETANTALAKANALEQALKSYYTKSEVDEIVANLKKDFNDSLAKKVDLAVYEANKAEVDAKFKAVDAAIAAVIKGYTEADAALNARIDSLNQAVTEALGAKLDTTTFNEFVEQLNAALSGIQADIDKLMARVQSVTYVPEYDDGRITFNWALLGGEYEGYADAAVVEPVAELEDEDEPENYVIVEPAHVKYLIYGEDAPSVVEALVAAVKGGNDSILTFDVVRVLTRVNKDGVSIDITDAMVDDMNPNCIDLTIKPVGMKDIWWFETWKNDGYYNKSWWWNYYLLRVDEEEEAEAVEEPFPAFSMCLVLTNKDESKLITSEYRNVVPAQQPNFIEPVILKDTVDITYNEYADTVEIEYIDLEKHAVLGDHVMKFNYKGEQLTKEGLAEKGIVLPEITCSIEDTPDYSKAIDETKLPEDYIIITKDTVAFPATADANLKEVIKEGVGAENHVVFNYLIGGYYPVYAGALVKVVPVKVDVVVDIWETEDLVPFTWSYEKDAEVDAAILKGEAEQLYVRDSAWADDAAAIAKLAEFGVKPEDFAKKVPVDTASTVAFYYTDADGNVVKKEFTVAELAQAEAPAFNIAPFFDSTNEGKLMAEVTNFNFFVDTIGTLDSICYKAIYNLPSDEENYMEVTVTGKILFADRDRTPIVIDLPETTLPYVVNIRGEVADSLYDADGKQVPAVTTPFVDHKLTNDNLIDAFTKDLYNRADTLYMTVEGEDVNTPASVLIIVTAAQDKVPSEVPADHVLDFTTKHDINNNLTSGKEFEPYATYKSVDTLWYGQVVIINKTIKYDVDGIFEFERIPEYVAKTDDLNYYTTLQPWWKPDGSTTNFSIPVNGYDAHKVLLNQHFRVVDVLKSIETGEKVVCTEIATVEGTEATDETEATEGVQAGDLKAEYKDILARIFKLEEPGHIGEQVDSIPDPRNLTEVVVPAATGVVIDTNNVVSYYSESPEEDAVGNLYIVNNNGSKVALITNFNRGDAAPSPRLAEAGVVVERYENYVIKLYDPLMEIEPKTDVSAKINVNNSIITETSIYQFIQLKDKRGKNLIDSKQTDEGHYGWVKGNNTNGFETGVYTNDVYSLIFTNEMEFVSEVSDETKARIAFDAETGKLTYDNTLQTQLAVPIDIKLTINIEYPWGTRTKTVAVQFYNKPVGE